MPKQRTEGQDVQAQTLTAGRDYLCQRVEDNAFHLILQQRQEF